MWIIEESNGNKSLARDETEAIRALGEQARQLGERWVVSLLYPHIGWKLHDGEEPIMTARPIGFYYVMQES